MRRALCLGLLLSSPAAFALPPDTPVPGGIAVIDAGPATANAAQAACPKAFWDQQPLAVAQARGRCHVLFGIPLESLPGTLEIRLEIRTDSGSTVSQQREILIRPKNYPEQRLTVKDKRKVEPDPADLARIEREQQITAAIKRQFSPGEPPTVLAQPAPGPLSSRFGLRRFFNGLPRNPHNGLDVAAPTGTPILAPADGIVANTGDYFFNGQTIFIDHGQGMISAYMHLSRIEVQTGQRVRKGQLIGAVGATGRVTGPHLHWVTLLNNTPVDPELLLPRP